MVSIGNDSGGEGGSGENVDDFFTDVLGKSVFATATQGLDTTSTGSRGVVTIDDGAGYGRVPIENQENDSNDIQAEKSKKKKPRRASLNTARSNDDESSKPSDASDESKASPPSPLTKEQKAFLETLPQTPGPRSAPRRLL